jgi:hypothetical protein
VEAAHGRGGACQPQAPAAPAGHGRHPVRCQPANFVAVKVGDPNVVHAALAARALIVRDGAGLGLPGWVRATIGTTPVTQLLAEVLAQTGWSDRPDLCSVQGSVLEHGEVC